MKIQEILTKTTQFFIAKQIDTARLDAELLISSALKLQRIDLYLKFDQPLKNEEVDTCRELVRRRSTGEPIAYILNEKGFYGLDFYVDKRVLIPRPETELLVERALEYLSQADVAAPQIVDLGSGSGCIALTLAHKIPDAQVTLVDLSEDALDVAKLNAERLTLVERSRFVNVKAQDLDQAAGSLDLVVANPPYIGRDDKEVQPEVVKFEPHSALFADDAGLREIREWTPKAYGWLKSGGALFMEIGFNQGQDTAEIFRQAGFKNVVVHKDLAGLDRLVVGVKEEMHG